MFKDTFRDMARGGIMPQQYYRAIWISDLHLGSKNVQSQSLLDFLEQTESEFLYLVGDIIDLMQLQKKWHWPKINDQIVQSIYAKAQNGTKVFYIPGNHDALVRRFAGLDVHGVRIITKVIHETVNGRRYLVMHGDKFDPVVQQSPRLASLGSSLYDYALSLSRYINILLGLLRCRYRSLSSWLKHQVKMAVNYMGHFEEVVAREGLGQGVDGLICGHIHRAGIRQLGSILYSNSGDWVESCTALAENHHGYLDLIQWPVQSTLRSTIAQTHYEDVYRDRCLAPTN